MCTRVCLSLSLSPDRVAHAVYINNIIYYNIFGNRKPPFTRVHVGGCGCVVGLLDLWGVDYIGYSMPTQREHIKQWVTANRA